MRYSILILLTVMTLFLSGCATAPKDAVKFSVDEIPTPGKDTATLVIYRKLVPPYAYDARVSINEVEIAVLPNEAFTWVAVEAGNHVLKTSWPFIAATPSVESKLTIEPGRYYFVELGGDIDSVIYGAAGPIATLGSSHGMKSFEEAVGELETCCRYVVSEQLTAKQ